MRRVGLWRLARRLGGGGIGGFGGLGGLVLDPAAFEQEVVRDGGGDGARVRSAEAVECEACGDVVALLEVPAGLLEFLGGDGFVEAGRQGVAHSGAIGLGGVLGGEVLDEGAGLDEPGGVVAWAFELADAGVDAALHGSLAVLAGGEVSQEDVVHLGGLGEVADAVVVVGQEEAGVLGDAAAGEALLHADQQLLAQARRVLQTDPEDLGLQPGEVALADVELAFDGLGELDRAGELLDDGLVVVEGPPLGVGGDAGVAAEEVGLGEVGAGGELVLVEPVGEDGAGLFGVALGEQGAGAVHELGVGGAGLGGSGGGPALGGIEGEVGLGESGIDAGRECECKNGDGSLRERSITVL